MPDDATLSRVSALVSRAQALAKKGNTVEAIAVLREASAIDHDNPDVQEAWRSIAAPDEELEQLCANLTLSNESDRADALIRALQAAQRQSTKDAAKKALETLLQTDLERSSPEIDRVVGILLQQPAGKSALAELMIANPTQIFHSMRGLGPESINGLTRTCISPDVWSTEANRLQCVKDTFTLLLAVLLEPGSADKIEPAMSALAGLMAFHASDLQPSIDAENLAIVLGFLNVAQPVKIRAQATLITAKYLEAAKGIGQAYLKDYVTTRIAKHTNDDIVAGFSAAAAVFPVTPDAASTLFLTPGFVDDLARVVRKSSSTRLRHAALELLSAACVNKDCRAAIKNSCASWLQEVVDSAANARDTAVAALVLTKTSQDASVDAKSLADVTNVYRNIVLSSAEDSELQTAVEGLAYSSVQASVKETIAGDAALLKRIVAAMHVPERHGLLVFGGLTIVSNLTVYSPDMSAEQKRMAQLKAYANQSKPAEPSPLDGVKLVSARAKKVLDAGITPVLVKVAKTATPTVLQLLATIALNLAKERSHCGILVQQGVLELLLPLTAYEGRDAVLLNARTCAAQALARTVIPIDPMLIFGGHHNSPKARSIATAIKAFNFLLDDKENQDPRPAFEALQALTNLASVGDPVNDYITTRCFSSIESYLSSNLSAQQQAAVECLSNLTTSESCCRLFIIAETAEPHFQSSKDGSTEARFLQLRALTEDNVRGIRLAAMATLYNITESPTGTRMLLRVPAGLERLAPLLKSTHPSQSDTPDADMRVRGAGCVLNVLHNGGHDAAVRLRELGLEDILGRAMAQDKTGEIKGFAEEAAQMLARR